MEAQTAVSFGFGPTVRVVARIEAKTIDGVERCRGVTLLDL